MAQKRKIFYHEASTGPDPSKEIFSVIYAKLKLQPIIYAKLKLQPIIYAKLKLQPIIDVQIIM